MAPETFEMKHHPPAENDWYQDWLNDPSECEEQRGARLYHDKIPLTLQEVILLWANSHESVDEWLAKVHATNNIAIYKTYEKNGLLYWRSYQEYRKAGMQIPEDILCKFDEWAENLNTANGASEIAKSLELSSRRGPQGPGYVDSLDRAYKTFMRVLFRLVLPKDNIKITVTEAIRQEAEESGMTFAQVKGVFDRWKKSNNKSNSAAPSSHDDLDAAMRRMFANPVNCEHDASKRSSPSSDQ